MLKRKITARFRQWKSSKNKTVLYLKGPKGVGKTVSLLEFAKENYENIIYLNFQTHPIYRSIFFFGLDMATLTKQITLKLRNNKLVPDKTLIILDEIHLCPNARIAAKTFVYEGKLDCAIVSSYAGAKIDKFDPKPEPHEFYLKMNSLDLEEFLWANGISEKTILEVKRHFIDQKAIPIALHEQFMNLFKEYMVVGGMPLVVKGFVSNHDFSEVLRAQQKILRAYEQSVDFHLKKTDRKKVRQTLSSIDAQLIKENKKFQYGVVEDKGNARKFESSVLWLYDADIINISFQLEALSLPFNKHARYDIFKVYFKDVGLLTSKLGFSAQQAIIDGNFNVYNSAILESVIADLLVKNEKRLFYYTKGTTLNMEFMIQVGDNVAALSVNDADNTKAKALTSLFDNHNLKLGIELTKDNLEIKNKLHRYPLYCVMFL